MDTPDPKSQTIPCLSKNKQIHADKGETPTWNKTFPTAICMIIALFFAVMFTGPLLVDVLSEKVFPAVVTGIPFI